MHSSSLVTTNDTLLSTTGKVKLIRTLTCDNVIGKANGSRTMKTMKLYFVTGTFHGSYVYAWTEGDARRAFHRKYNGESIINVRTDGTLREDEAIFGNDFEIHS